jgi:hypothetical protein
MMGAVPDRVNVPLRIAKMMAERLDEFIDKAEELGMAPTRPVVQPVSPC